jgi:hypothetical protein
MFRSLLFLGASGVFGVVPDIGSDRFAEDGIVYFEF